jgi:hypothetical protein
MKRKNRLTKPNIIISLSALALVAIEFGIFSLPVPQAVAGLLDRAEPFCIRPACDSAAKALDIDVLLGPNSSQVIRDTRNGTLFTLSTGASSLADSAS